MSVKVIALIPARYASTRFPGKPLADLLGKPMIQHTYERVGRARGLTEVLVATDDVRIAEAVRGFGGQVVMTSTDHLSGTDRIAEAVKSLDADIIVNIQGDEPLITPEAVETVVQPLLDDSAIPMTTLAHRIHQLEDLLNPHMGKVVLDARGFAMYFSRSPLPFPGDPLHQPPPQRVTRREERSVRTAVAQWHTKALRRADNYVGAPFTRWLEQAKR